ncbi:granulins-like [Sinocyclocheilus rhinocerous]|uniref:granulins-like n=1 Tax=Sinocyclocheilus rhinocerous TaxID=307959 RepID=UPI0007B966B3|nr:PREDICTED: granulins-like [Sinocyclocheilus rhinocerous]
MVRVGVIVLLCVCLNACGALICPDGGMCEDGNTCCQTPSGGYGCCPLPNAECCSDHLHCCYQGTLCDLVHSKCVNKTHILDWVEKVATKQQAVICPDQESECPDDTTCCQMPDGSWGCCPMKDAVCCEDKRHCCPQGTKCDLEHSRCVSATYGPSPLWRKFAARRRKPSERKAVAPPKDSSHIRDVICPDEISTCPDDTTCCELDTGSYGCCPMPKAVCCSDHVHCCPEATTCDLVHSMCVSASGVMVKMATKIPATSLKPKEKVVPCNETVACASGTTCCKTQEGTWACCPLPKAVCCEDHIHCCPEDTVCDLAASTCDDPADLSVSVPWMAKVPTFPIASSNQKCDETSSCPDGSTCCRLSSGKWGCCPLPQAVCCKDGDHCCPNGYTCNEKKTSCSKAYHEIPWFTKQEARVLKGSEVLFGDEDVKCDSTTSCASGSTCCKLPTGQWGCCPLVQAVCCEDHEHCCPQGYTCDLEFGTCVKASSLHSVLLTRLQTHTDTRSEEEVLCDASTRCSKTQSCCRLSDSSWACCPYKEAVCCEDMKHCCPVGYKCDPEVQGCTKASTSMWWENAL